MINKINVNGTLHDINDDRVNSSAVVGQVLTSGGSGNAPVWKTGELIHQELTTTGTAAVTTSPYNYAKWEATDSEITELYDGLTILYEVPVAGHKTYGTCLQINSLGYHPVVTAVNSLISTRYAVGNYIILCYDSTKSSTVYANSDTSSTITGVWRCVNDYDSGNTNYIPSAMLNTAASTAEKTADCTNYALLSKSYLHVVVRYSNSAKSALTLSVNNKTAKPIYINGTASSSSNYTLPAGTYLVYYDGTNYYFRTDGKITTIGLVNTSNTAIYTNTTYKFTIGSTTNGDSTNGVDLGTLKSETASSNGNTLSLVTTGEKATWNAKLDEIEFNTTYNASTNKAATMSDIPSSLPANGGNAATVGGHTVGKDVPSNALFTDTTYVFNTAYNESTNKAATMADIPDVSNKENKVTIVSVASGTTTLTAAAGNYYVFADTVGTMTVTLPLITGATTVSGLVLNFTTGSSPNFTITAQGGATVSYYIDYSIDANKSYELNCLWNGTKWIVAYGKID